MFLEDLNKSLFLDINATLNEPTWLINIAKFFAEYLIWAIPLVWLYFLLSKNNQNKKLAYRIFLTIVITFIFKEIIALFYYYPRPAYANLGNMIIYHANVTSFPSGHMAFFCGFSFPILHSDKKKFAYFCIASSIIVAWSRIFLGVHYPLDMLGSVILVILSLFITNKIIKKW